MSAATWTYVPGTMSPRAGTAQGRYARQAQLRIRIKPLQKCFDRKCDCLDCQGSDVVAKAAVHLRQPLGTPKCASLSKRAPVQGTRGL